MSDTLREIVARAIYEIMPDHIDGVQKTWEQAKGTGTGKLAYENADAALSALRAEGALIEWNEGHSADQSGKWLLVEIEDCETQPFDVVQYGDFPYDAERDFSAFGNDNTLIDQHRIKRWAPLPPLTQQESE